MAHKIWNAFLMEDCVTYDAFVDFIKNTLEGIRD